MNVKENGCFEKQGRYVANASVVMRYGNTRTTTTTN
jgi:hypothetical protein